MAQVTDLRNSSCPLKRNLRQSLMLLQDNYHEFAARQIFINVPWWYLAYNKMASHIFTQRSKSKYIALEKVPVQFGGMSDKNNPDFTTSDIVTVVTITPLAKQVVDILITEGSLCDLPSLLEAVKQADVVICAVPSKQALEQKLLVRAIKEAGCIKSFVPSEFGADPDKVQVNEFDYGFYAKKAEIRRFIEKEGIPYTCIACNFLMSYLLPSLVQPGLNTPPRDEVKIFGEGNTKAVFVEECDVATFTISTIDDPRTLNKVLYLRPPGNVVSMNEVVEMWEMKIGKKLMKAYVSEDQVLKSIQEAPFANNMELIFIYSAFIKGDQTYFNIDRSDGLDGTMLYPHVKYATVEEFIVEIIVCLISNFSIGPQQLEDEL